MRDTPLENWVTRVVTQFLPTHRHVVAGPSMGAGIKTKVPKPAKKTPNKLGLKRLGNGRGSHFKPKHSRALKKSAVSRGKKDRREEEEDDEEDEGEEDEEDEGEQQQTKKQQPSKLALSPAATSDEQEKLKFGRKLVHPGMEREGGEKKPCLASLDLFYRQEDTRPHDQDARNLPWKASPPGFRARAAVEGNVLLHVAVRQSARAAGACQQPVQPGPCAVQVERSAVHSRLLGHDCARVVGHRLPSVLLFFFFNVCVRFFFFLTGTRQVGQVLLAHAPLYPPQLSVAPVARVVPHGGSALLDSLDLDVAQVRSFLLSNA